MITGSEWLLNLPAFRRGGGGAPDIHKSVEIRASGAVYGGATGIVRAVEVAEASAVHGVVTIHFARSASGTRIELRIRATNGPPLEARGSRAARAQSW